ncbi:mitochondrial import inner membrane translocase subunit tim-16 [Sphaerosporella brunnea]|uniref:Mitochondrial import inner membrane translocase subunit TIM16 n=1 Tax=Sphaerosporella brunnea TaxID=1250544 RepID=A0A5J5F562_9PEZI|nr:mitochondrial import inner membrane translocase subunit tim-16 [Sphaerosporella brunnea]
MGVFGRLASAYRRTVINAWEKAQASQRYAAAAAAARVESHNQKLTLSEACKILNVAPPQGGKMDMDLVMSRFKRLFDVNEPGNGGSFYLQSKVLRARQRIEEEIAKAQEEAEREEELEKGWKPKLFR